MANGQRIIINNTSGRQLVISYQRLNDFLWVYNEPVRVGQTKTITIVENTLRDIDTLSRFIDIEFLPERPIVSRELIRRTPTPTPTKTSTPIAPRTICLSVTEELTWDVTTTQLGVFNGKPYFGLYYPGNILIPNYFIKWNSSLQRWELVTNGLNGTTPNSILTNSSDPNVPIGVWTPLVNPYTFGMVVNSSFLCVNQSTPTPTPTSISQKCYAFSNITVNWPNSGTNCQRPKNLKAADFASYVLKRDDSVYAPKSFTESCINCNEWNKGYGNPTPESLQYTNRYTPVESTFNVGDLVYLGKFRTDCLLLTDREGWYFMGSLGCSGETIYVSNNGVILAKGKCGEPQPKLIDEPKNTFITINYIDCCGIEKTTRFNRGSGDQTTYVINGSIKGGSIKSLDNPNAIINVTYFTELNNCTDCCATPTPTTTKTPTPTPTSASKVKVVLTCCAAPDTNTSNIEVDLPSNFDPEEVYLDDLGIGWYYAGPNLVKTSNYKPKTLESIGKGVIEGCLKIAEATGAICIEPDIKMPTPTPTPSSKPNNIYLIGCCCSEGYVIKPDAPLIDSPTTQIIPNQVYIDNQGFNWISVLAEPGVNLNVNTNYTPSWFKSVDIGNQSPFELCLKYCEAVDTSLCPPFNPTPTPMPTKTPTVTPTMTPTLTSVNNSYCHTITNTGSTTCIIKWIDRYFDRNEVCLPTGQTLTICAIVGTVESDCIIGNTLNIVTGSTCNNLNDCFPTPTPSATPTSTPNYGDCKEFIVSLNEATYLKYAEAVGLTGPEEFSVSSESQIPEVPFTNSTYNLSYIDCCNNLITIQAKLNEPTKICAKSVIPSIFYDAVAVGSCSGSCTSALNVVISKKTNFTLSAVTCDGRTVKLSVADANPGAWFVNYLRFDNLSKTCFQKGSFITDNTDVTFDYLTTQTTVFPCDCEIAPSATPTTTSTPTPTETKPVCALYSVSRKISEFIPTGSTGLTLTSTTYTFEYIGADGKTVYETVNSRDSKVISALKPPVSNAFITVTLLGPCQGSSICISYEPKVEGYLPGTIINETLTPETTLRNGKLWYKSKRKAFWEIYWETASGFYQNKWVVKTPNFVDSLYRCTGVTNSYLNSSSDVPLSSGQQQWVNLPSSASCRSIIMLSSSDICPTPTPTKTPTPTPSSAPCVCPSGFTLDTVLRSCYRTVTIPSLTTGSTNTVSPIVADAAFGDFGFLIYNLGGYDNSGQETNGYAYNGTNQGLNSQLNPVELFWMNRLNEVGVWVQGNQSWPGPWTNLDLPSPYPGMVSFCTTINVLSAKTYYFGIAADNDVRLLINNQVIIAQLPNRPPANFKYWHIYPITLNVGQNTIRMEGWNRSKIGGFAGEIYDNTLQELTAATATTMLNMVFSTGDYLDARDLYGHTNNCVDQSVCPRGSAPRGSRFNQGFCSSQGCPSGFTVVNNTNSYSFQCIGREYVDCGSNPNVTPTPTKTIAATPTKTPTPTPTKLGCFSTVFFNPVPSGVTGSYYDCCENIIKVVIIPQGATSFTTTKGCIQSGSFNGPLISGVTYSNPCDCEPPVDPFCIECNPGFSSFGNNLAGAISLGNLTGTCNITDYQILWYGPNSDTNVEFRSGFGSTPGFDRDIQHPFTRLSLPGLYKPVLNKVRLSNGTILDNLNAECFQSIGVNGKLSVVDITCDNGNLTSGETYTHFYQFNNASYLRPPQSLKTTMALGLDTKFLAFSFDGQNVPDTIKISFLSDTYETPLVLENVLVGNTILRDLRPSIPLKSWRGTLKKVLTLTGLTRNINDRLLIEVIPNESNPQTVWNLYLKCLTGFTQTICDDSIGTGITEKVVTESLTSTSDNCTTIPNVWVSACTRSNSDVVKYLPVSWRGYEGVHERPFWPPLAQSSFSCGLPTEGTHGFCVTPIAPNESRRMTYVKTPGNLLLEFANYDDFVSHYNNYRFYMLGFINDPTSVGYYQYITYKTSMDGNKLSNCGDLTQPKSIVIHKSSTVTTAQTSNDTYVLNFTLPQITRSINFNQQCSNCNTLIDEQIVSVVNGNSVSVIPSGITITNNRLENPFTGAFLTASQSGGINCRESRNRWSIKEYSVKTYPMSGNPLTLIPSLSGQAAPMTNHAYFVSSETEGNDYLRDFSNLVARTPQNGNLGDFDLWSSNIVNYRLVPSEDNGSCINSNPTTGSTKIAEYVDTDTNILQPTYFTSVSGTGMSLFIYIN